MNFNIQYTDQKLQSNTGLSLISKLLDSIDLDLILGYHNLTTQSYSNSFSDKDILLSYLGLVCLGHSNYEAIDLYKSDIFFQKCLGLKRVPSKETLRQRLDKLAVDRTFIYDAFLKVNFDLLNKFALHFQALNTDLIPVDFDVTVMDNTGSKKEGVKQSYMPKIKGYSPMMSYLSGQGYLLNQQFRPGNAHSNCEGTLEYILQTMNLARRLFPDKKLIARFDSGNDSEKNLVGLSGFKNTYFIVKHHLKGRNTKSMQQTLIQFVLENYSTKKEVDKQTVYYEAEQIFMAGMFDENENFIQVPCRRILSVVELNQDVNTGAPLLIPYRSLHMWRTNLPKSTYPPKKVISLYKDHATSEQFHSEFKSDLDMERLPSTKFMTNKLCMAIAHLAYNLLRIIGDDAVNEKLLNPRNKSIRLRIRTILLKIIYHPSMFIRKNKKWTICLPRSNPMSGIFEQVYLLL